jgi:hypothetical protein
VRGPGVILCNGQVCRAGRGADAAVWKQPYREAVLKLESPAGDSEGLMAFSTPGSAGEQRGERRRRPVRANRRTTARTARLIRPKGH